MKRTPALAALVPILALFGAVPPAQATGYQVGVLMSGSCAGANAPLTIFIDNEDSQNVSYSSGWIGSSNSSGNTLFKFCRVDGRRFFHVPGSPYAVLSLGSYCPNGSLTVIRHFDAEDPRIGAYPISSTNIDWSAEGLPRDVVIPSNAGLKAQRGDVQMTFCLFDGLGYQTGPMPALGFDYGVFAPSGVSFAIATGTIFTDDQDGAWQNEWCHDISTGTPRTSWNCLSSRSTFRSYGGGALEGADNTWLRLAKVKGTVCGDWLCNGTETCSTCQHDCGVCPVCPNGICEGGEYCPQDCGVCGDGICTGSETCSTCCGDCGTCTGEPWSCQQN